MTTPTAATTAPLTIDLRNLRHDVLGPQGLDWEQELATHAPALAAARDALLARREIEAEMLGWLALPGDQALLDGVRELESALRGRFSDLVVLGIGGSSLGGLTLLSALQHPYRLLQKDGHGCRVHFVENVDGDVISGLLEVLDPQRTLINVISKSGTTTETMAAYLACKAWLQAALGEGYAQHIVATTDPAKGVLRPMAERYGYRTLSVPPSVGGRFSVLAAVGLFPAAMGGLDVAALLAGAEAANQDFAGPVEHNPTMQYALANMVYAARGKNMTVMMPYSTRLRFLSDWFAQLWAESLGKRVNLKGEVVNTGTTPIKTIGTTDQHSQVQLYAEGPNDKLFTFVRLTSDQHNTMIPNAEPNEPDMNYLDGKSFQRLLNAEQAATASALRSFEKPNMTLIMPKLDAYHLGYLLQTLMLATAVVGEIWGINTFDQPGVELGKRNTYALMGRPGFEGLAAELAALGVKA
jgi:glucose-6-phosphate isomerase